MALDENGNEIPETSPAPFDEAKMAQMIQEQVTNSFKTVLDGIQTSQPQQGQQGQTPDPIAEWLNPHLAPHINRANLASASAMDKADFYSSEVWEDLDSLIGDGESDSKEEKREIRSAVEKKFEELMKAGVPTPRKTVLELVLGQKLSAKPDEFAEKAAKRSAKKKAAALSKASAASDIGTSQVASMSAEDVYAMKDEDFEKAFANISF